VTFANLCALTPHPQDRNAADPLPTYNPAMKIRVYVETSVISYLTARRSRDPVKAARQLQAQALWDAQDRFSLVVSPAVLDEALRGNPSQAALRGLAIESLPSLSLGAEAEYLAQLLLQRKALPNKALADAVHIAIATTHKIKVVASFNFRHLASVFARAKIEQTLRQLGYEAPLIATPEEILGASDD
jgi:predicted nucleic acid-binding protein